MICKGDRDLAAVPFNEIEPVSGLDPSLFEHLEIETRAVRIRDHLYEIAPAVPRGKRRTGLAGLAYLHQGGAGFKDVADMDRALLKTRDGKVFTEGRLGQRGPEDHFPIGIVVETVYADRLVGPTVVLAVPHPVALEPQFCEQEGAADRLLAHAGDEFLAVEDFLFRKTDVEGADDHGSVPFR